MKVCCSVPENEIIFTVQIFRLLNYGGTNILHISNFFVTLLYEWENSKKYLLQTIDDTQGVVYYYSNWHNYLIV